MFSAVFVIPPYGTMGELSLLYVFYFFVCLYGYDFSVAERVRGVKFCTRV